MLKISVISQVRSTSEIADIFNAFDENIFGIYGKKINVLFIFFREGDKLYFFPRHFSLILLSSVRLRV